MIWLAAQPCIACRGGLLLRWVLVPPVSLWYVLGRYRSPSRVWTPRSALVVAHSRFEPVSQWDGERACGTLGDRVSVTHDTLVRCSFGVVVTHSGTDTLGIPTHTQNRRLLDGDERDGVPDSLFLHAQKGPPQCPAGNTSGLRTYYFTDCLYILVYICWPLQLFNRLGPDLLQLSQGTDDEHCAKLSALWCHRAYEQGPMDQLRKLWSSGLCSICP